MNAALQKKLQKKAAALLVRRAYSRGEMRLKLRKLADGPETDLVLDRLEELKLLNDVDYAYNFALSHVGRDGWGPGKIRNGLLRRRVCDSVINDALYRIAAETGADYGLPDYLNKYFGKRGLPEDATGIQKLIAHLRRRGFPAESIKRVLNNMLPSDIWRHSKTGD